MENESQVAISVLSSTDCPVEQTACPLNIWIHEIKDKNLIKQKQKQKQKHGYPANTSCGWVGRGGNERFHTFKLDHHDRRTDGRTDGRTKPLLELRVRN